jgi:peptidyl-dipeptidase Dcp
MNKHPLEFSDLPHHAIPFDQVKIKDFLPRLEQTIALAKKEVTAIATNTASPTFLNTVAALETAGQDVTIVSSVFYNLLHAHTNDELQKLAQTIGPVLSAYSSDITLNPDLFKRIKVIYDGHQGAQSQDLSQEDHQLLEETYKNFTRNGALLNEEQKLKLRKIDEELSKLSPEFSDNVLKATNAFQLWITDKNDLSGVPEAIQLSYQEAAKQKGRDDAWLVDLQAPSYVPFMQYADRRELRQKLWQAFATRAFGGPFDNQKTAVKILTLREERAQLLGYRNHAHFVLEKRMAETSDRVFSFLKRLTEVALPKAKTEVAELSKYAGLKDFMPWDFSYYAEKLKEERFKFNSEELRPYFPLTQVEAGVFEHARRLYGLKFTETKNCPVYHPDVKTYEVSDEKTGRFIGLFYADYFPRESKNGGAWCTSFFEQGYFKGKVRRPHIAIVCNFTKPTSASPSLLSFDEVLTLFHEFGHALHGLLSDCHYTSLAGTNVYWDFVELPSQIMENWIKEPESLALFARHYETGAPLPPSLAQKLKDSEKFLAAYHCVRQVQFATLDMLYHTTPVRDLGTLPEFEDKTLAPLLVMPKIPGTNVSCSFSHIFAGGYSAGYYSYKWAEVLDADAFEYFLEKGIFNQDVAKSFRDNILSRGGTEHPMTLYKKFRGREPDPDALFRRDGLVAT